MTIILPKKKQALLAYLKRFIAEHGYAPTLSECAKAFGVHSLATMHEHLQFLEENGFVRRSKGGAKDLIVVDEPDERSATDQPSVRIPLVGLITAGKPIEAIEDREAMVSVPQEIVGKRNAYMLKVRGDSMIESLIADGDYVVVEKTDYARDGDMVVALLEDGTATLKKFYRHKNYIRLQPANKKYRPLQVRSVVIQGRVLGVIRKITA
jgi:repressor LexA